MANSLKTALMANVVIAIIKFVLGGISGSAAMISEGYHSLSDSFNQILLFMGIARSKKQEDAEHNFGYAKVQFFWAFVVAILIFGISGTIAFTEGLSIIRNPEEHVLHPEFMIYNLIALALAILLEGYAFTVALNETRTYMRTINEKNLLRAIDQMQDPVLNSVLVEDGLALVGLVIAFVGILLTSLLELPIIDGITSLIIGIVLGVGGLLLARENMSYLIGKAVNPRKERKILEIVNSFVEVNKVQNLRTMLLGPKDMIIALDIDFFDEYETGEIGELIDRIEDKIAEAMNVNKFKIFIEAQ